MCSQPGTTTFKLVFIQNREKCALQSTQSVNLNVFKLTVCMPVGNSEKLCSLSSWERTPWHSDLILLSYFAEWREEGALSILWGGWPHGWSTPRTTLRVAMGAAKRFLKCCDNHIMKKYKVVSGGEREAQLDKSNPNEDGLLMPLLQESCTSCMCYFVSQN